MIHTLAQTALGFAALGAFTFVLTYELVADWRSTPLGRNVMAFMAAVWVLLTLAVLRSFIPWVTAHTELLRTVSFSVVGLIIWHRVYLLFKAQTTPTEKRSGYGEETHDTQRKGSPT